MAQYNHMENETITNTKSTPKDVFLHLFNILTFYISVIAFITICVQYINAFFPDVLSFRYEGMTGAIRWATSVLVVSVPTYLLTAWLLARDIAGSPQKRELKLRKWLLYFTLFVSAITIVVSLITFVYNFLSGELTIQFFLKILVVLLVAVAVFGYYIWELKRGREKSKTPKMLAWVVAIVVLASIVGGFFIVGTPSEQRERRLDEQRISNLQVLQSQIVNFWMQKEKIPQDLTELEDSISGFVVPKDPESGLSYEYIILSPLSFGLCATFKTSGQNTGSLPGEVKPMMSDDLFRQNWAHEAGRVCFARTIDPELYKVNSPTID